MYRLIALAALVLFSFIFLVFSGLAQLDSESVFLWRWFCRQKPSCTRRGGGGVTDFEATFTDSYG